MKQSFYDLNYSDLEAIINQNNLNRSAAAVLFNWHYKKKETGQCYDNIAKSSLAFIENNFDFSLPEIDLVHESTKDRTVKFLFKLKDQHKVETVLIPFNNKYSICLSSQVGCAMNCSFCFTGEQGFKRNLTTSEIVGQFLQAWRWLASNRPGEERILNIVFMGQGEPLHNFDAVKKACEIFLSQHGTSVGVQKITISTAGYIPGLKRWSQEIPGVNLALSLHSPFAEKRNELIPINKKYPLDEVLAYIDKIPLNKKQFVTYEYILIKDFNDTADDAKKLGALLEGKEAYINLIPFNSFPGSRYESPDLDKIEKFKEVLDTFKITTLIRIAKGDDVLAACGQLNSKN
ncbi:MULTISPECIES: 23S rRNA (adenine(2503)-C(2))-methyltransferase RlmN [Methylomonas]|uniref:23S rRNA (Adenine(2503)-C2)-methyltransferase n=2 Tax=Methylomonas TaxID=416 RepID=A0A126T9F2_9GAMM|nr:MULTISPECIES: 23S rRNA (adenine(2503)-C(2))-methyltransferase RlmN [Methylomonas]AMK78434.1 23S rRNA (adenine(2503)-C2)-methyltransferase [Methylomonas denitrificans]OAI04136.1 23S rRNA (adenine(2503)-C(2))-methyltransferase RlmN [Methylomonas methanica]TCV87536.1 23S rRNA m(2)A-2503 methyltransferase [Methylomonas methanica]